MAEPASPKRPRAEESEEDFTPNYDTLDAGGQAGDLTDEQKQEVMVNEVKRQIMKRGLAAKDGDALFSDRCRTKIYEPDSRGRLKEIGSAEEVIGEILRRPYLKFEQHQALFVSNSATQGIIQELVWEAIGGSWFKKCVEGIIYA